MKTSMVCENKCMSPKFDYIELENPTGEELSELATYLLDNYLFVGYDESTQKKLYCHKSCQIEIEFKYNNPDTNKIETYRMSGGIIFCYSARLYMTGFAAPDGTSSPYAYKNWYIQSKITLNPSYSNNHTFQISDHKSFTETQCLVSINDFSANVTDLKIKILVPVF